MNTRNAGYNSAQNLQSSCLLSKNIKIKVYGTINLPSVLYGRDTWSLTLREEHRLRVFENRVLREIFGSKRDEVTGECEDCIMRSFMTFTVHQTLFGPSNRGEWDGVGGERGWARGTYVNLESCIQGFGGHKGQLGRARRIWVCSIQTYLEEVRWKVMNCIVLDQDRCSVGCLWIP